MFHRLAVHFISRYFADMAVLFSPPMPHLPSDDITGLGVLFRLKQNGFGAFPARCFYEPVLSLRALGRPLVVAAGPEAIKAVLSTDAASFQRLRMGRRVLSPIVGEGILVSEGAVWRRQRKAMAPAFTPRTVPTLARHIAACADMTLPRVSMEKPVDVFSLTQTLALDIAAVTMFSMTSETFGTQLRTMVTSFMSGIGQPRPADFLLPPSVPTLTDWRRKRFRRRWVALIEAIIAERPKIGAQDDARDLFDLLMQAFGEEGGVAGQAVVDEVATMIVAGHETTATALFWAVWLLANAPEWQDAIAEEVHSIDLSSDHAAAALPKLTVTTAVVREALRLFPPAFMTGREAVNDVELCGRSTPGGAMMLLPFWMLHRNPELWENPAAFDPGRFLNGKEPERFTFLPFGAGPHVCIGAQLAMTEAVLVLARLVQLYRFTAVDDEPVLPVGVLSTRPSRSVPFRFFPRRSNG
ncbi:cytochrome P450 [Acetobacter aceti NRIC 0242]|uniref:Cytochrome P450 n=2 Tax=Acetobacter aceti TaxID=435 RepID=A0AB33IFW9_ACEAC|nr:cytochrome P450 [Acetobacter aceti NBRC 14818]BCK76706.1 cytochrome P450 [Acetobacter aceti NBRC 14818]GAN58134.1 cytochrome P451 [Acetobacter aceti NBRC 14818]GBO82280.1 cytochrome P450 [Acetobacter aceti NRIC 0242]